MAGSCLHRHQLTDPAAPSMPLAGAPRPPPPLPGVFSAPVDMFIRYRAAAAALVCPSNKTCNSSFVLLLRNCSSIAHESASAAAAAASPLPVGVLSCEHCPQQCCGMRPTTVTVSRACLYNMLCVILGKMHKPGVAGAQKAAHHTCCTNGGRSLIVVMPCCLLQVLPGRRHHCQVS